MSWFHDNIAAGFAHLEEAVSDEAVYRRGGQSATVRVTLASSQSRSTDAGGNTLVTQRQLELLIRPSLLDFGSGPFRPVMGDLIELENGRRFEVVADAATNSCWAHSDAGRTFLRINVDEMKQVSQ